MTHKALSERTTGQQAYGTKGDSTMRKTDSEKVIKDLKDYRLYGDRQRLVDEIDSYMEDESVSDTHATVKQIYLGFLPDKLLVNRLTCELATWEMQWDKQSASWEVENWADVETIFQIDFTKERIPWKKLRGLAYRTDEEWAEIIASSPRFENELIEAAAKMPIGDDELYSAIADPILRKVLKPEDG
jgi:hypothetical protein